MIRSIERTGLLLELGDRQLVLEVAALLVEFVELVLLQLQLLRVVLMLLFELGVASARVAFL